MKQEVRDFVAEKTRGLLEAFSCCAELKAAAQAWLDALDTPRQEEETRKYLAELAEDVVTVDGLIAFAQSPAGEQVFGPEGAAKLADHGRQLKAEGAAYCDCPACAAAAAILALKEGLLAQS